MSLKIIGIGKGIPKLAVSGDDLSRFVDTSDEWIVSRTGIKTRHICTDETLTDLACAAARQAMEKAGISINDVDLIICSTMAGDFRTPSLACCVGERLKSTCPAFDVNAACTGFIYALEIASGFLASKKAKNVLIICAEKMSALMDFNDRNTCVLFGDGAAACVVTSGDAIKYMNLYANGDSTTLNAPYGTGNNPFAKEKKETEFLHMQGQDVFKFAVNVVDTELTRCLDALNISPDEIDWFLLHQANKRIIDSARTKLKQPAEKFPINIDRYGNLSSASVPLLLFEMLEEGKIKPGDKLFMTAFGAGLTAGSCVMVWE